ncbi:MAG: VanZ family protein [bacterium]
MNKSFVFRVVTVLYLSLIFYISSLSMPVKLPAFPGFDKIIHFLEFGLVGYLVYNSIYDNFKEKTEFFSISFSIFYGGLDEIHQYFVPGRNCDWTDFLADSLGIIAIVLFCGRKDFSLQSK